MMKKVLFLAFAIIASLNASARYREGTLSLQPKTGALFANLTNMPKMPVFEDVDLDSKVFPGVLFGGELEYQLTDMVGLAAGLNYSLQGGKWKDYHNAAGAIKDVKIELGYINVPLVVNVYLYKGLAVKTGLQVGFMTNAKMKGIIEDANVVLPLSDNYLDDCNTIDLSIPFGLSYEFDGHVVLDARYMLGLTNVNKDELIADRKMKNSIFMLTVGYKIDL